MRRSAIAGMALTAAGAIGLLSSEMVATAFAGRLPVRYLVAVSTGATLTLVPAGRVGRAAGGSVPGVPGGGAANGPSNGVLVCGGVASLGRISLGYQCQ